MITIGFPEQTEVGLQNYTVNGVPVTKETAEQIRDLWPLTQETEEAIEIFCQELIRLYNLLADRHRDYPFTYNDLELALKRFAKLIKKEEYADRTGEVLDETAE